MQEKGSARWSLIRGGRTSEEGDPCSRLWSCSGSLNCPVLLTRHLWFFCACTHPSSSHRASGPLFSVEGAWQGSCCLQSKSFCLHSPAFLSCRMATYLGHSRQWSVAGPPGLPVSQIFYDNFTVHQAAPVSAAPVPACAGKKKAAGPTCPRAGTRRGSLRGCGWQGLSVAGCKAWPCTPLASSYTSWGLK